MIETPRPAPARVLKQRDVLAAATRPAIEMADVPRVPAATEPERPASAAGARCVAKEARIVASEGGAQAIEVRCSCGEWTRVEVAPAQVSR
jgi:hypothetical protein